MEVKTESLEAIVTPLFLFWSFDKELVGISRNNITINQRRSNRFS